MTIKELKDGLTGWKFTRERTINLAIGLVAILVYELIARPIYRPYIYKSNLNDFHIADTIGNSLGTVAAIFLSIGFLGQGRTQHFFLIKNIIMAMALYELAQPLLGKPIDPWDIVATIITGGLSLMVYNFIHPVSADQKNIK